MLLFFLFTHVLSLYGFLTLPNYCKYLIFHKNALNLFSALKLKVKEKKGMQASKLLNSFIDVHGCLDRMQLLVGVMMLAEVMIVVLNTSKHLNFQSCTMVKNKALPTTHRQTKFIT